MTLRDHLVYLARAGDLAAFDILIGALPVELPASIRRAQRDIEIHRIAAGIRGELPGASCRRIAGMIAAAGAHLEGGHRGLSTCPECRWLTAAETATLAAAIGRILEWA